MIKIIMNLGALFCLLEVLPASLAFSSPTVLVSKRGKSSTLSVLDYSPNGEVVNGVDDKVVNLVDVLCTCVRAAQVGCNEIRRVHSNLDRTKEGIIDQEVGNRKVDYKIEDDPRSALTAADLASQVAIMAIVHYEWPKIQIVGEEDMACAVNESDAAGGAVCASDLVWPGNEIKVLNEKQQQELVQLKEELNAGLSDELSSTVKMEDVTIFVDPLDGTREFVEGRVQNVQSLIGISVRGLAVAGAIGLPFARNNDGDHSASPVVVCALDGAGPPRIVFNSDENSDNNRADPDNPIHGGGRPEDNEERPLLVCGDVDDRALEDAYAAVGGQSVLLGGTGQKCLAVAEGRADIAIMNFKSSAWDTCAPEALVRASGGKVTDIFGERILHCADPQSPATIVNTCGVVASSAEFTTNHDELCQTMRDNSHARELLKIWGLEEKETIQSILDRRQKQLIKGI